MTALSKPILFIGAAGNMCRVVVQRFVHASDVPFVLADINTSQLGALLSSLPDGRATTLELNIYDADALHSAVGSASLVVLGAGPYSRTAEPVLRACITAKVPYLDFDDDVSSTQLSLDLTEQAKAAGVACYKGCGASPGLSNIMAVDAASELDSVDLLEVCWVVGDERPSAGRAVLEHLLHIAAGPCLTWADGRATVNESWVETTYAPISGTTERFLHETAHPEPVTLPRLFPNAKRIRCMGSCSPAPKNGIARGLGNAVRSGALSMEEALDFLTNLMSHNAGATMTWAGGLSSLATEFRGADMTLYDTYKLLGAATKPLGPWRHAMQGMLEQVWTGECSMGDVADFLWSAARGESIKCDSGILVRAVGTRNGHPAVSTRRTPKCGDESVLFKNMGSVTGISAAAFMVLALEGDKQKSGVLCPEDWVDPQAFYKALQRVGVPEDDIVESV